MTQAHLAEEKNKSHHNSLNTLLLPSTRDPPAWQCPPLCRRELAKMGWGQATEDERRHKGKKTKWKKWQHKKRKNKIKTEKSLNIDGCTEKTADSRHKTRGWDNHRQETYRAKGFVFFSLWCLDQSYFSFLAPPLGPWTEPRGVEGLNSNPTKWDRRAS